MDDGYRIETSSEGPRVGVNIKSYFFMKRKQVFYLGLTSPRFLDHRFCACIIILRTSIL